MKLILFILVLMPSFIFSTPGTIIILNGPSAAGKSSIQNELQKNFHPLYLKVGIDNFFDALIATPDLSNFAETKEFSQYTNDGILIRKVRMLQDAEGNQIIPLDIGPAGDQIISGMHRAFAAYASSGNNLVVDYILYKPEMASDLAQSLKDNKVYLIGIFAPLSVLEEREKNRGTSPIGHARSHYDTVHQGMVYDLKLDVSDKTPQKSALEIIDFVQSNPDPKALKSLYLNP